MKDLTALTDESIALLQKMVAIPSISRDEKSVADMLQEELTGCGL